MDGDAALRSWRESLSAPAWRNPEVWVHGDLLPGNLLVVDGRLSAVIDFGGLNVGDPACDLQPAWNVVAGESRLRFRAELRVDDASWSRGRGWAPYQAMTGRVLLGYQPRDGPPDRTRAGAGARRHFPVRCPWLIDDPSVLSQGRPGPAQHGSTYRREGRGFL
ncbi:phosphotransferase [Streptosporangium sp. NPDC002607]